MSGSLCHQAQSSPSGLPTSPRADAAAVVLSQNAVGVTGKAPIPFELAVDAADVDERADIAVWARLRSAVGTWVSDTHTPVLTRGAGDIADVVVRRSTEA